MKKVNPMLADEPLRQPEQTMLHGPRPRPKPPARLRSRPLLHALLPPTAARPEREALLARRLQLQGRKQ